MTSDLATRRLTPCVKRPVTKLLASPVTVWNRRRCLRLAQRGQCPSDKPVGDHGGWLACSRRVSPIGGSHVSGMGSSKQQVTRDEVQQASIERTARSEAGLLPSMAAPRLDPTNYCHQVFEDYRLCRFINISDGIQANTDFFVITITP